MTAELKPCPFEANHEQKDYTSIGLKLHRYLGGNLKFWYECGECGARGPRCNSHETAFSAWNRRAQ